MKCPRCGNEVSSEEAFCGQCGTPSASQARPTEMGHTPPQPIGGQPQSYPENGPFGQPNGYGAQSATPGGTAFPQAAPVAQQSNAGQRTGFYQDATEAMSVLPSNPNANYQQQSPVLPQSGTYPPQSGQYGFQPHQSLPPQNVPVQPSNYGAQGFPQPPMQAGYRGIPTPPPAPKNNGVIVIVSICLVVALLSLVGVATLYLTRGQNTTPATTSVATVAPTIAPTIAPTAAPTDVPTVAPTTAPTTAPTVAPTTVPADPGFLACTQQCIVNGFTTEYPDSWTPVPLSTVQGIGFISRTSPDQSTTFKTPGATNGAPSDIVAVDLSDNFAAKDGYTVVTPNATATIGGETWFKEVITYQGNTQKEQVEVYGAVHQGKAYILELQASEAQFADANTMYFANIVSHFAFQ